LLVVAAACTGVEVPRLGTEPTQPHIGIALAVAEAAVDLGGGDALFLTDDRGEPLLEVPAGTVARAVTSGDRVSLRVGGVAVGVVGRVHAAPMDSGGTVRLRGREYRGLLVITPAAAGLLVVNLVGVEPYLAGVVSAEMGRRLPGEEAALQAQAIASRTFALRALGRRRTQEYDLVATTADQVYGGMAAETPMSLAAVRATRGRILTWGGQPIDAFFHSTCGGRTAAGGEVFANGDRSYLRSIADVDRDGLAWCAISPRFRWTERWSGQRLHATLRATLPSLGIEPSQVTEVRDMVVTDQTPSGRVNGLSIRFSATTVPVTGAPSIRQVLQAESGQLLRSASFRVRVSRVGGQVADLTLEGQGSGHGVGLCQWGAIGRARAGQTAEQILAAYFPGAALERRW
jgi:stage II sporulation protein D